MRSFRHMADPSAVLDESLPPDALHRGACCIRKIRGLFALFVGLCVAEILGFLPLSYGRSGQPLLVPELIASMAIQSARPQKISQLAKAWQFTQTARVGHLQQQEMRIDVWRRCSSGCDRPKAVSASATHQLPDGTELEVLSRHPDTKLEGDPSKPPIVFLHGSYHAAWTWEKFIERFASIGYSCYAVSFRGHGGSGPQRAGDPLEGTLERHAADIIDFIGRLGSPPILIGHSFGGLIAQVVMTWDKERVLAEAGKQAVGDKPNLAGVVLLNSVPPIGNDEMTKRFVFTKPFDAWRVTMGFIRKTFLNDPEECRYLFFSKDLPESDLLRYQKLIRHSTAGSLLNLRKFKRSLPIQIGSDKLPPIAVVGAEGDMVVDVPGVRETAEFFGVAPVLLEHTAHDSMLDSRWEAAADVLEDFFMRIG